MQKITTFLMYNDKAGEAMEFYASVFENSRIVNTIPGPNGSVLGGTIEIDGHRLLTFNGGPHFSFSPGFSLFVNAVTQDEIDYLYERLSEGGAKQPCGWLVDKFGVSWQIIPPTLMGMLWDEDRTRADRVTQAMFKMQKLDISELQRAYDGE